MSAQNEAVVLRLFEAISAGDEAGLRQVLAEECPVYGNGELQFKDQAGYVKDVAKFHDAFSDFQVTIEDLFSSGDRTATRVTVRGTHMGAFEGIEPTSKTVQFSSIAMHRISNGKIVEEHYNSDFFSLMQQIGAFPS